LLPAKDIRQHAIQLLESYVKNPYQPDGKLMSDSITYYYSQSNKYKKLFLQSGGGAQLPIHHYMESIHTVIKESWKNVGELHYNTSISHLEINFLRILLIFKYNNIEHFDHFPPNIITILRRISQNLLNINEHLLNSVVCENAKKIINQLSTLNKGSITR
ncbi:hypothetical protein JW960_17485, partial [candidate division KSB1 bacterium]|nr:hypothetical protein [candidate division KSB1 bacterium]